MQLEERDVREYAPRSFSFFPMRIIKILVSLVFLSAMLSSCSGSKTNTLWTEVYPDYVAVYIYNAPKEFVSLRDANIMNGDDWYWSKDGKWLFVKRPIVERSFGYVGKTLGTPIAMSWDGVIIVAQTLDGSVDKQTGTFVTGLAQLAAIIGQFRGK